MEGDGIIGNGENWRRSGLHFICLVEVHVRMKSQQVDASLRTLGRARDGCINLRMNDQKPQIGMKVMRWEETIRAECENTEES